MNITSKDETNVLGVTLKLNNDFFTFEQYDFTTLFLNLTIRSYLALLAKPFDPLGFLSLFIMYAKLTMQLIWLTGLEWNDDLPDDIKFKSHLGLSFDQKLYLLI